MKKIIKLICTVFIVSCLFKSAVMANGIIARLSDQTIYVDGRKTEITAYSINDNNYVRLRELGKDVDFSVLYDHNIDTVRITRAYSYADGLNEALPSPGDNVNAVLSNQQIHVNGMPLTMTAYNIADNNYVRLRDIGGAINLGMAYDPDTDSVYIDTQTAYLPDMPPELLRPEAIPRHTETETGRMPITEKDIDGTAWSREDFSLQANPSIFDDYYTRDSYNAIRQSIVDRDIILADNDDKDFNPYYKYAHFYDPENDDNGWYATAQLPFKISRVISRKYDYFTYLEPYVKRPGSGYSIVQIKYSTNGLAKENFPGWSEADKAVDTFLKTIEHLSGSDRIKAISRYLGERLYYDLSGSSTSTPDIFTSSSPGKGACLTYAYAFQYICEQAKIPCVRVTSNKTALQDVGHAWNAVYADGKWRYVDPTNYSVRFSSTITDAATGITTPHELTKEEIDRYIDMQQLFWEVNDPDFWCVDENPIETRFGMELLVPGSTK